MWSVLTTPKLVCLPMHPGKLLRTSFHSQKDPELTSVALCVAWQGGRSPWAISITSHGRGLQGPRLTFGQADLKRHWAGPRGREGTPRRKRGRSLLPARAPLRTSLRLSCYPSIPSASTQRASSERMAICWGQARSQAPQPTHSEARLWPCLATSQPSWLSAASLSP